MTTAAATNNAGTVSQVVVQDDALFKQMMMEADENCDGKISFGEFQSQIIKIMQLQAQKHVKEWALI